MLRSTVILRGGGDLATGIAHRLRRCGYRVLILECRMPAAIRRKAAFCEAVYDGIAEVEGVVSRKVEALEECRNVWQAGEIPVLVGDTPVEATLTGILRGIIREWFPVRKGLKIADIDPRKEQRNNQFDFSFGRAAGWEGQEGYCGHQHPYGEGQPSSVCPLGG